MLTRVKKSYLMCYKRAFQTFPGIPYKVCPALIVAKADVNRPCLHCRSLVVIDSLQRSGLMWSQVSLLWLSKIVYNRSTSRHVLQSSGRSIYVSTHLTIQRRSHCVGVDKYISEQRLHAHAPPTQTSLSC